MKLSDFDPQDIINYVTDALDKVVLDPEDLPADTCTSPHYRHPSNYIDTAPELREHLIDILGLGHYVSNDDIIRKVQEILQ